MAFQIIESGEDHLIQLIASWYLQEWKIPAEKTTQRLKTIAGDPSQFQVLMTLDGFPIATGGLYNHVGLVDKEPRFGIHKSWLALVYTVPEKRGKGFGAHICEYIQGHAKKTGIKEMHLFTDTAESLYRRLGWQDVERLSIGERNIVVMKKEL